MLSTANCRASAIRSARSPFSARLRSSVGNDRFEMGPAVAVGCSRVPKDALDCAQSVDPAALVAGLNSQPMVN